MARFRKAWEMAPREGRQLLIERAERDAVGHHWERGHRACVLALLAQPALRPSEPVKAGAYRLFGCDITDEFPVTWDGQGVTLFDLLASVGVQVQTEQPSPARRLAGCILPAFR